jgi:hypothetical protein
MLWLGSLTGAGFHDGPPNANASAGGSGGTDQSDFQIENRACRQH